jgi:hypothetical protein
VFSKFKDVTEKQVVSREAYLPEGPQGAIPAAPHVPPLGEALQRQPQGPELHLLRAVPGDGLRPAHLP